MELRWKPFDDFQDELDSVINEYQTMQKLLGDEDSFYNDDGSLTQNGLTNVLLLQESIDATKDKLANYRVALDKLEEQYQNGCYSAEEYKEKTEELLKGIQDASSSMAEYRQQILSVYETQVKTENDLLQKILINVWKPWMRKRNIMNLIRQSGKVQGYQCFEGFHLCP